MKLEVWRRKAENMTLPYHSLQMPELSRLKGVKRRLETTLIYLGTYGGTDVGGGEIMPML